MKTLTFGMKNSRFTKTTALLILISIFLASCTGGSLVNNWPGISANQDIVYLSYQGAVHAVNAGSGTLVWSFPKEKPDASKPFYAAPGIGPDGLIAVGNYGQVLYALRPDGNAQWEFTVANANFAASPLVLEDVILAPASDGFLYAVTMAGTQKWKFGTQNMLWAQPASDGELVYLSGMDHFLYALRLSDGSLEWKKDLESSLVSSPVRDDNGALFISTLNGVVMSLNAGDGSENWRFSTQGTLWSSPVLHDDVLFVGSSEGKTTGKIFAISASGGGELWQKDAGSPVIGGGALLTDKIVFPTEGGKLTAWSISDGSQKWTQEIGGKLYSAPVVAAENLVVAITQGEDKILQAVSFDGQTVWTFVLPK